MVRAQNTTICKSGFKSPTIHHKVRKKTIIITHDPTNDKGHQTETTKKAKVKRTDALNREKTETEGL